MRNAVSLPALLLAVLLAAAGPARADGDALSAWRDVELLRRHLEAACEAVEQVCGATFPQRPGLRISTQAEVEEILRMRDSTERGIFEQMPDGSRSFLAYYEPTGMDVHILPDELGRIAEALRAPELLGPEVMRIILVHEATHALDFQRFPVKWTLACCARSDERLAIEAALEGHAQLVSEEVSRTWGIVEGFRRLTRLYTGSYGDDAGFDQEAAFAYLQGHAFMRTIRNERGRAGVEAVLRDPPCETRIIDRPLLWLEPSRRGLEPDLQATLEAFRPLIVDPTWEVAKWRLLGTSVEELTRAHSLDEEDLTGYVDNHGLYAGSPDGSRYLNVFLTSWDTPREAQRFADALMRVDRERDEEAGWDPTQRRSGAGSSFQLPGFTSWRHMTGAPPEAHLTVHVARAGRHVIELSSWGVPDENRDGQARAIDRAAHLLSARPAEAAALHLRQQIEDLLRARSAGDLEGARIFLRDLLPSDADLRRIVLPDRAAAFEAGYTGPRLALRTTPVPPELTRNVFGGVSAAASVRTHGATTEELVAGGPAAAPFPPAMREFARKIAYPGIFWLVVSIAPPDGSTAAAYACFARLGDRFLWVVDPWTVL